MCGTVHLCDDVTSLHPSLRGRATFFDVTDERAARIAQPELLGDDGIADPESGRPYGRARPSRASRADPSRLLAVLAGMANPTLLISPPLLMIAVLMPTSSPLMFTRAPPELPGFIGGVGLDEVFVGFDTFARVRWVAPTIPMVTVWPMPKGLPMARTMSPDLDRIGVARSWTFGRLVASILRTATSESASFADELSL